MAWRLAISLETLRKEVNAHAPNRNKKSDGTIGDPAHASRASRHNKNKAGVVTAWDATHDPLGGFDAHRFARLLVAAIRAGVVDVPDLEYIISNGEVASRVSGWVWRKYGGSNPHKLHVHFGVGRGPDSNPVPPYDGRSSWFVTNLLRPQPATPPTITHKENDMVYIQIPDSVGGGIVLLHAGKMVAIASPQGLDPDINSWDLRKDPTTWDRLIKAYGDFIK